MSSIIDRRKLVFFPDKAAWTLSEIAEEVNDVLDASPPLTPAMISIDKAHEFVNLFYDWLTCCIDLDEETNLEAEEAWQRKWYEEVIQYHFGGRTYARVILSYTHTYIVRCLVSMYVCV